MLLTLKAKALSQTHSEESLLEIFFFLISASLILKPHPRIEQESAYQKSLIVIVVVEIVTDCSPYVGLLMKNQSMISKVLSKKNSHTNHLI